MSRFQEIARIDEELYQFACTWKNEKVGFQRLMWQVDLVSEMHYLLHNSASEYDLRMGIIRE